MLRLIALFIIIYLIFRVITTWLFPRLVRWYVGRARKRFYRDNPDAAHAAKKKQDLERPSDRIGEYVDFEEIKDDKTEK